MMIKKIVHGKDLIAVIIPRDFHKEGVEFFTPPELSQQLGYMKHPQGRRISPHTHFLTVGRVDYAMETVLVRSGRIRVDLFSNDKVLFQSEILMAGDVILLAKGGHAFVFLEDSELIEIKQGPYLAYRVDKEDFKGADDEHL